MTESEAKKAFEEFKAQGWEDNDILSALYIMYRDDKLTLDELRGMTKVLGYEFTDEFEAMSDEDKKKKGLRERTDKAREGVTEEEVEEAEEYGDDEDEEREEKKEEKKEIKRDGDKEEEVEDEEIERKKALKMFGLGDK